MIDKENVTADLNAIQKKVAGMQKLTKVASRLDHALKEGSSSKLRSADLVPLTQDFELFRREMRALVESIKKYHDQSSATDKARHEVRYCVRKILVRE
mgnify:CR=1 FL=1